MSERKIITINNNPEYDQLLLNVGETLEQGRQQAVYAVNSAMVQTYWEIGRQIVEYEQHGNEKAEYGSDVLNRLSRDLTDRYGKGFSRGNVFYMRKLFITYPKVKTLSELLTWSHYVELLKIDDPLERSFYEKERKHRTVKRLANALTQMKFMTKEGKFILVLPFLAGLSAQAATPAWQEDFSRTFSQTDAQQLIQDMQLWQQHLQQDAPYKSF